MAGGVAARRRAEGQRLVAQAMSFLEENEPPPVHILGRDAPLQRIGGRQRQQERIVEQPQYLHVGAVRRQRQHHGIEIAARKFFEQHLGLGLADLQTQLRIARLQPR